MNVRSQLVEAKQSLRRKRAPLLSWRQGFLNILKTYQARVALFFIIATPYMDQFSIRSVHSASIRLPSAHYSISPFADQLASVLSFLHTFSAAQPMS